MPPQGGAAWAFNTMVKPSVQPGESNKDGISLEEKAMVWKTGNIHPNKKGGKGRNPTPQKWDESGKDAWGIALDHMGGIDPEDFEEEEDPPLESEEERMRKRAKERAARILGPREEEEIKEEGKTEIWSESPSTMPNSPMAGVV